MYTLQTVVEHYGTRYRWLYTDQHGTVYACGIGNTLRINPRHDPSFKYISMAYAHSAYPQFTTILTTDDPSSLPQTHPELFI